MFYCSVIERCYRGKDCTKTYTICVNNKCTCEEELISGEKSCDPGENILKVLEESYSMAWYKLDIYKMYAINHIYLHPNNVGHSPVVKKLQRSLILYFILHTLLSGSLTNLLFPL